MVASFSPPWSAAEDASEVLAAQGFVVLPPDAACALLGVEPQALAALESSWDDLRPDTYLRDGGRYRHRRHACFVAEAESGGVAQVPHRAHWQSLDYNALHGGMQRWFEPVAGGVVAAPAWRALLSSLARLFRELRPGVARWHVEAHQFRIDTGDGIGRPTPEGAHRDGVDFVAVFVVARLAIKGGETRVFAADGPGGQRFTLNRPWSLLLLDDARVIHESTPIQPADEAGDGHRDTLVLTYRADGFQGDDVAG